MIKMWKCTGCTLSFIGAALALFPVAVSPALADSDNHDPRLMVSDNFILPQQRDNKVTVTIHGKASAYYTLALGDSSTLFSGTDDRLEISAGAVVAANGKLDRDGNAVIPLQIPTSATGRTYLQVATTKQVTLPTWLGKRAIKDVDLSDVSWVISLNDLLRSVQISSIPGAQGPAGPQGPVGPVGPAGQVGPAGPVGPEGPVGATGAAGVQGPAGPIGPQGAQGPTGPQGAQGPAGPQGPAGATGAVGPQGAPGIQGETGAVGPAGPVGAVGPKGDKGDTGAQGPAGPQGAPAVIPQASCPAGWIDLGPTCMEPNFDAAGTIEQALQACFMKGARICEHQELAFACMNRDSLGINFPDSVWLHTGTVMMRSLGGSSTNNFVGYAVYRRSVSRCFGPATINPGDAVIGYDLDGTSRNYACCANRSY